MKWFEGKLAECIKDVKEKRRLLFVFSKDESSPLSASVLETLNEVWLEKVYDEISCLLLTVDSEGYKQFTAIYATPSLPCIHLILPSGGILGMKTSDFAPEQLSSWLKEHVKKFVAWKAAAEPVAAAATTTANAGPTPPIDGTNVAGPSADTPASSENSMTSAAESTSISPITVGAETNSASDQIERARQLLQEKRDRELEEAFEQNRQAELDRRRLGKQMVEFKERQREQSIKEQLEARKREQAEDKAAREQILRQIELDRQERAQRLLNVSSKPVAPPVVTSPLPSPSYSTDKTKVRLQLRLPDGDYISCVLPCKATLAEEVRQHIFARVASAEGNHDNNCTDEGGQPLSLSTLAAFQRILRTGYTFKQFRPARPFSEEDETKTLEELDLWPSAVLLLVSQSNAGHDSVSPYAQGSLVGYTQDALYQLVTSLGSGLRTGVNFAFSVGNSVYLVCQSLFTSVFGGGRGQTTGRSPSPVPTNYDGQSSSPRPRETETTAFRRHGNVSRLSHMPDDTDEQARWNGNSTTQM